MGTWGPAVFENDHALDLCSGYENRIANDIRATLAIDPISFDDIEGPLVYVRLLTVLGAQVELTKVHREEVSAWRDKYLEVFTGTYPEADSEYAVARRAVILAEFEALEAHVKPRSSTLATIESPSHRDTSRRAKAPKSPLPGARSMTKTSRKPGGVTRKK